MNKSICCYFTLSMHFWLFFQANKQIKGFTPHQDVIVRVIPEVW